MQRLLTAARSGLPEALPQGAVDPEDLLDQLRRGAHRVYLAIALATALACTALALALGLPHWQVAVLVAGLTAGLLWLELRRPRSWRWRLRLFTLLVLAAMCVDFLDAARRPPVNSLVLLPVLV